MEQNSYSTFNDIKQCQNSLLNPTFVTQNF